MTPITSTFTKLPHTRSEDMPRLVSLFPAYNTTGLFIYPLKLRALYNSQSCYCSDGSSTSEPYRISSKNLAEEKQLFIRLAEIIRSQIQKLLPERLGSVWNCILKPSTARSAESTWSLAIVVQELTDVFPSSQDGYSWLPCL